MFVFIFVLSHSLKNKIPKLPTDRMTQAFIYATQISKIFLFGLLPTFERNKGNIRHQVDVVFYLNYNKQL